jgi:hypothetical protein
MGGGLTGINHLESLATLRGGEMCEDEARRRSQATRTSMKEITCQQYKINPHVVWSHTPWATACRRRRTFCPLLPYCSAVRRRRRMLASTTLAPPLYPARMPRPQVAFPRYTLARS